MNQSSRLVPIIHYAMNSDGKLSKACDACKTKKIKCDRQRPTCGYCRRHDIQCNFSFNKRPGLKPGYGKQITERIGELESLIDEYKGSVTQIEALKRRVEELEDRIQSGKSTDITSATVTSISSFQLKTGSADSTPPTGRSEGRTFTSIPDKSACQRLLQVYLEDLYNIIPLIHPLVTVPVLLHHLDDPTPTLYAVILLTLRLSQNILAPNEVPGYYNYCRGEILSRGIGMQDHDCLTALALLSFDFMGSHSTDFENGFSLLVNGCEKMALFDEAANNTYTFKQDELQLVWTVFVLDRVSLFVYQKSVIKVPTRRLPIPFEKSFSGGQLEFVHRRSLHNPVDSEFYDSNSFYIEIVHHLEQFYSLLLGHNQSPVSDMAEFDGKSASLRSKVDTWKEGLPVRYQEFLNDSNVSFKDSLTVHDILLHSCYHLFLLVSNGCFLFGPTSTTAKTMQQCSQTSRKIIELCRNYITIFNNDKLHQLGFLYIITLWAAARISFVHSVHVNEDIHKDFDFVTDKLYSISTVWKLAQTYGDALTKMKQEYLLNRRDNFNSFQDRMLKGYESTGQSPITEHFLYGTSLVPQAGILFDVLKIPI